MKHTNETAFSVTPAQCWGGSDYILAAQAQDAAQKPGRARHERRRQDAARAHAKASQRRAERRGGRVAGFGEGAPGGAL